jgi:hypothetical protein
VTAAARLGAELERRVLYGLGREYDLALGLLDGALRRRMPRPLFALSDLTARWGQWCGRRREIVLSRELVFNYPWGAVREVLRHEMAHQLAECLDGGAGKPHGSAFFRACRLLRADPAAAASYRVLNGRDPAAAVSPEERLRRKVCRLFALADSPNPHEAASAMRKARELMARWGSRADEGFSAAPYISILLGAPALRHLRRDYLLAQLLVDLYAVAGVWVPAFVVAKGRMGRALEISGRPTRVQVAAYAHDFVGRFIDCRWRQNGLRATRGRRSQHDFAVGVIEGFRAKIAPGPVDSPPAASRALVAADDPALAVYLRQRYPRVQNVCRRSRRHDDQAYDAGIGEGRRLVIHPGVGEGAQQAPKAIGVQACRPAGRGTGLAGEGRRRAV